MEKALVNFFNWLQIRSALSHYGESFVSVKVPSNSIKSFFLILESFFEGFNSEIHGLPNIE